MKLYFHKDKKVENCVDVFTLQGSMLLNVGYMVERMDTESSSTPFRFTMFNTDSTTDSQWLLHAVDKHVQCTEKSVKTDLVYNWCSMDGNLEDGMRILQFAAYKETMLSSPFLYTAPDDICVQIYANLGDKYLKVGLWSPSNKVQTSSKNLSNPKTCKGQCLYRSPWGGNAWSGLKGNSYKSLLDFIPIIENAIGSVKINQFWCKVWPLPLKEFQESKNGPSRFYTYEELINWFPQYK